MVEKFPLAKAADAYSKFFPTTYSNLGKFFFFFEGLTFS
jgi:hypothetical protein